jgi:hypothetical protein
MLKIELNVIINNHKEWVADHSKGSRANLSGANLGDANLSGANLSRANLSGADLSRANLDFSCLPLWCGGQFKADKKICQQLVAHTLRILELSDEGDKELHKAMRDYKAGWHREEEF